MLRLKREKELSPHLSMLRLKREKELSPPPLHASPEEGERAFSPTSPCFARRGRKSFLPHLSMLPLKREKELSPPPLHASLEEGRRPSGPLHAKRGEGTGGVRSGSAQRGALCSTANSFSGPTG